MRKSFLFESVTTLAGSLLLVAALQAQPSTTPAQKSQPPVSLSPAMPTISAPPVDPNKMAEPVGGTQPKTAEVDVNTFILGAEDQVMVRLWDEKRLDGSYTIRPDGMISLPLLNEIKAAGLTPMQLQTEIDKRALSFVRDPRTHVDVLAVHSKRVYFDGEGIAPGPMELTIPVRLFDAISIKGGFKDFADKKHIRITRDGKPFMVVNYKNLTNGKHPELNILLQPGDHILVN